MSGQAKGTHAAFGACRQAARRRELMTPPEDYDAVQPGSNNGSAEQDATDAQAGPMSDRILGTEPLDRATRVTLLEDAHEFPGPFTIVVIAHAGEEFEALLRVTLVELQDGNPFSISERASRKGTYVSYRVEVHVADAPAALDRKDSLSALPGLVTLF
jgi:putative lipoic acid-binding regulatory protein